MIVLTENEGKKIYCDGMSKQMAMEFFGWGFLVWLIGYGLGMVFFTIVPPDLIGWFVTPIGIVVSLWVLFKKIHGKTIQYYLMLACIWTLLAVTCDYLFLVRPFKPINGYNKLDVYLYYFLTFMLPLFVWWRKGSAHKKAAN